MEAVADAVGRRDRDVDEADRLEPGPILGERERAGDAADEAAALRPLRGGQRVVGDDVADAHPAARSQDPGDLGEDREPCRSRG